MRCVRLDNPHYHLPWLSATFHGRDIFAPCSAHLIAGVPLAALGSEIEPSSLIRLDVARRAEWRDSILVGRVAHVDHYGNLITNIGPEEAHQALADARTWLSLAGSEVRARATHFAAGPNDAPFLLQDSSGMLAVVVRGGSAARTLGAQRGDGVALHGLTGEEDAAQRKRRQ
jgi:S-adenosylmethionine hydrolase